MLVKKIKAVVMKGIVFVVGFGPMAQGWFLKYFLTPAQQKMLVSTFDPVRCGAVLLAIKNIQDKQIPGVFAEAGVFKGHMSKFIHDLAPQKKLFLFDTFEGFPKHLIKEGEDPRFNKTSMELVKSNIGNLDNIVFKQGNFPQSAKGLEGEKFAFVMIDFDLYESTKEAMKFFYPRLSTGGYIFLHDYNSPESEWGVSKAVNEFMADKPEHAVGIPDRAGTVIIRKS